MHRFELAIEVSRTVYDIFTCRYTEAEAQYAEWKKKKYCKVSTYSCISLWSFWLHNTTFLAFFDLSLNACTNLERMLLYKFQIWELFLYKFNTLSNLINSHHSLPGLQLGWTDLLEYAAYDRVIQWKNLLLQRAGDWATWIRENR